MHELINSMVEAANKAPRRSGLLLFADVRKSIEPLILDLSEAQREDLGRLIVEGLPQEGSEIHRMLGHILYPPPGGS